MDVDSDEQKVMSSDEPLKVGYVPEHFSAPLHLAELHGYYSVPVTLLPYPSGTGHMIQSLKSKEIDVAVGLTEGWIAGIKGSQKADFYRVVGGYVETPLCWAISTGRAREVNVEGLHEPTAAGVGISPAATTGDNGVLKGRVGVSRIGSGSYIMSFVLAQQKGWLRSDGSDPFEFVVLDNFKNLRDAVNSGDADAFMWEHFTSKKFYDSGEIKRIGEIYTPWPSWLITAHSDLLPTAEGDAESGDPRLPAFLDGVNQGIEHFKKEPEESIEWITENFDYSGEDASTWMEGVQFVDDVRGVEEGLVEKVVDILKSAGVVAKEEKPDGVIVRV